MRLLALLLLLTACADRPVAVTACPPVIAYTPAEMQRAADELHSLPPDAELRQMMADYATTRDRLRVCR